MRYQISTIEGIGPSFAKKLEDAKIVTTDDLLKFCCDPAGRRSVSTKTGIDEAKLLKWVNMADLMRISGVGGEFAELMESAGVDTIKELGTRNADSLAEKVKQINETKKLTRAVPAASVIHKWIEQARTLEAVIRH
jgi:predicted flap endonuclease-1-like 5' DNA nuclease